MTELQKIVKYLATGLAAVLAAGIIGGIISMAGWLGELTGDNAAAGDLKTYPVSSAVSSLTVSISAADITIRQGDSFSVESNLKHLEVAENMGTLSIRETKKLFQNYNRAVLIITLPVDTVFEKAELVTGAGKLTADVLSAQNLSCDFGAGEIKIGALSASQAAQLQGGAGKITISGGSLHGLDFDMGVGQLNFTSALTGESTLRLGIGESNLTLLGSKEDYTLNMEKGLGDIRVDGSAMASTSGLGTGENKVTISGGIGSVFVSFAQPEF